MATKDRPYYTLTTAALAGWLESRPDIWWSVDGDPMLTSIVDFPCPVDELAPTIRQIGTDLWLYDKNLESGAHGEAITGDKLDDLADTSNKRRHKILHLSWKDSDVDWLLIEDEAMTAD